MSRLVLSLALIFIFMTNCDKAKDHDLLYGEWKLIEVYGPEGWNKIPNSPVQTIKFSSNGIYSIATDGTKQCSGNFQFNKNESISLNPHDCLPIMQSTETIFKLTIDTLIISNHSISYSSFSERKDKYTRN